MPPLPDANTPQNTQDIVREEFARRFGTAPPCLVRAPGRVNLIGEHTDYNDGFVLPLAIDRATWIAFRERADGKVHLYSLDQNSEIEFDLAAIEKSGPAWGEYPKGVAWVLREAGYDLHGWEGVSSCDVPMGAGLSSSASFELAVARAFAAASGIAWDAQKMARLCQKAENQWVGVNCGIMDQMISAIGREGHAVLIDCRDFSFETVPMPTGVSVVVMDTSTRRGLVASAYNERRAQCEAAAAFFGVTALRDVPLAIFQERAGALDEIIRRRARHVVTENVRTLGVVAAMRAGDAAELGKLVHQCHQSLRDDFEVSNAQLDIMVEIAIDTHGCFGARMTGAGFGGCAIALVEQESVDAFVATVSREYQRQTQLNPKLYICRAAEGASEIAPC